MKRIKAEAAANTASRSSTRMLRRAAARRFDWLVALVLLLAGGGGFWYVINTIPPIEDSIGGGLPDAAYAQAFFTSPNVGGVVLLLLALFTVTLGGAWFVISLLHWRFRPAFEPIKVWRQALWAALVVAIGAWLQLSRALTVPLGALIAGAFVMIEVFLNVREQQE